MRYRLRAPERLQVIKGRKTELIQHRRTRKLMGQEGGGMHTKHSGSMKKGRKHEWEAVGSDTASLLRV